MRHKGFLVCFVFIITAALPAVYSKELKSKHEVLRKEKIV